MLVAMDTCSACGAVAFEGARFCASCGAQLREASVEEERKPITALVVGIVDYDERAAALDPELLHGALARYEAEVRAEVERVGGSLEKFVNGRAIMLLGTAAGHENDPERAVRAAFAMLDTAADLRQPGARCPAPSQGGYRNWRGSRRRGAGGWSQPRLGARRRRGERTGGAGAAREPSRLGRDVPATAHAVEYRDEPVAVGDDVATGGLARVALGIRGVPSPAVSRAPLVGRAADLGQLLDLWDDAQVRASKRRSPSFSVTRASARAGLPGNSPADWRQARRSTPAAACRTAKASPTGP